MVQMVPPLAVLEMQIVHHRFMYQVVRGPRFEMDLVCIKDVNRVVVFQDGHPPLPPRGSWYVDIFGQIHMEFNYRARGASSPWTSFRPVPSTTCWMSFGDDAEWAAFLLPRIGPGVGRLLAAEDWVWLVRPLD